MRNRVSGRGSASVDTGDEARRAAAALPEPTSGPAGRIWAEYFAQNRPSDDLVRGAVLKLHEQKQHEHVIHAIQSALLNGQSQPWMYEVLALSMEVAGRPKADVQRVLLSLTDFGSANFESMMYSAAYLTRFERNETALRLYRQASRMAPERPEPYILGLKLAKKQPQVDDVVWAATGILEHGWTKNYEPLHREAEDAAAEAARRLQQQNDEAGLADLKSRIAAAKRRDLVLTLTWNGAADLDLIVEEPGGTVCSFESPDSPGGGVHLQDGYGPRTENCREVYVCPQGVSGDYRIIIRRAWGDVVGRRAQLTITQHAGSPEAKTTKQSVVIGAEDAVVTISLEGGRRTKPREVATSRIDPLSAVVPAPARPGVIQLTSHERDVRSRFLNSRENSARQAGHLPPTGAGAVGYQPVITNVNEGSFLTVNPVVSADRRYVRIAVNPVFTNLTDVFQFSFINGQ
ncbi:MAG: hypothetical protein KF861_14965 [Planctomycetaceae bacterium]|nr:hypothetical protein [Planctomycetaceae bacterium]